MKNKKGYLGWGLTAFLTVCAILVFYDTFFLTGTVIKFLDKLFTILAPVLYGFALAYILAPVVNFFERTILKKIKASKKRYAGFGCARALSILLTWLLVLVLMFLLMNILIPQLAESIKTLVGNAENYYNTIYNWVNHLLDQNSQFGAWALKQIDTYYADLTKFLTDKVLPQAQQMVTVIGGGVWSFLIFLKNLVVGIVISVYMLAMKEKSAARCCKMVYGICKREEDADWVVRATHKTDDIFSGFVRGKLLDSLIIGLLCFIGCTVLDFPYAPLISVIVGVTNMIPFFGPVIGAVPSAFLILLVDPLKSLYFIIFVFALQQLDGNVIGPKILGSSTGLSSFWVVVAILVGGGFGGVLGMFLGVPVFACFYSLVRYLINRRLTKRNMTTEACDYVNRGREVMGNASPGEKPKDQ
jgi:predicted PurR-regulated permease PerM